MKTKKILVGISLIFLIAVFVIPVFLPSYTKAQAVPQANTVKTNTPTCPDGTYCLISKIGTLDHIDDNDKNGFSGLVNTLIKIAIAVGGAICVIVIVINGVTYMGTSSIWEKGESKLNISSAIGGLVLLLCSYLILYTINPKLVNINIGGQTVQEEKWGGFTAGTTLTSGDLLKPGALPEGVYCPKTGGSQEVAKVAKSFIGKVTYRYGGKINNTAPYPLETQEFKTSCPTGQKCLDCSGFVDVVLMCTGLATDNKSINTGGRTNNKDYETITNPTVNITWDSTNGLKIKKEGLKSGKETPIYGGDVLVWPGHVYLYIGGGEFIDSNSGGDSHAGKQPGMAIGANGTSPTTAFTWDWIKTNYIPVTAGLIKTVQSK